MNAPETVVTNPTTSGLLTSEQLARFLGVSARSIRRLTTSGQIPCVMVGPKLPRYRVEDVIHALRAVQQVNHHE